MPPEQPSVGLFATCLVDLFRPNVGFATVKLLEEAHCRVEVPSQTCCGQPAYNSGDQQSTREIAKQVIAAFEPYDYVVAPSGSCIGMLREHYPLLFPTDTHWRSRAERLAERCHEILCFLHDILGIHELPHTFAATVTYHDSCSGLRELGIQTQPRALLGPTESLRLVELDSADVCCGFGGTFCVKYPKISARLVADKVDSIRRTEADVVLGGDLGCLLNIAGRLRREGSKTAVYHVVEVLAGMADVAPIGGT